MRIAPLILVLIALLAAFTARADIGALDPAAKPGTRLGPGFQLALSVSVHGIDEPELSGAFPLDGEGRLEVTLGFQPLPKIGLRGLTVDEARERILAALRPYFAATPEVRAGIARIPRFDVVIQGAAFASGIVKLTEGSRLSDLLAQTSYLPNADLKQIQIRRAAAGGAVTYLRADFTRVTSNPADDRENDPPLQNGDLITIPYTSAPVAPSVIFVHGEVVRQGSQPFKPGMTVRDAVQAAILRPTADHEQLLLQRRREGSYLSINLERALREEPTHNLKLMPDDTLFVTRKDTGRRYAVVGAVPAPQTFEYRKEVTLKQAILDAGGLRPDADRGKVVLMRHMLSDPSRVQALPINFDKVLRGEAPDVPLQAGDMVQVPHRPKRANGLLEVGVMLLRFFLF